MQSLPVRAASRTERYLTIEAGQNPRLECSSDQDEACSIASVEFSVRTP